MADASLTYAMVSIVTIDNEWIQILKLRGGENSWYWPVYVQTTLESKGYLDIVTETRKTLTTPATNTTDLVIKEHSKETKSYVIPRNILVLIVHTWF